MRVSKFSRILLEEAASEVFRVALKKRMLFRIEAGFEHVCFSAGYFRLDFEFRNCIWFDNMDADDEWVQCSSLADIKAVLYKIPEFRY